MHTRAHTVYMLMSAGSLLKIMTNLFAIRVFSSAFAYSHTGHEFTYKYAEMHTLGGSEPSPKVAGVSIKSQGQVP